MRTLWDSAVAHLVLILHIARVDLTSIHGGPTFDVLLSGNCNRQSEVLRCGVSMVCERL